MITQEYIVGLVQRVPSDIVNTIGAVKERGVGHYRRPLLIAVAAFAAIYFLIYKSPTASLQRSRGEISTLAGITQYAGHYRELKDFLGSYYASLPRLKDKDRGLWLTDTARDSMKAEGVFFTSMSPVIEQAKGYYVQESVKITCRLRYKQLASWVARLERSSHAVRISDLSLTKDNEIGMNKVDLTISAVFPKEAEDL